MNRKGIFPANQPFKVLLLVFCLVCCAQSLIAQEKQFYTLSGRVLDSVSNESLIGVNIVDTGLKSGAVSDAQGRFSFRLGPGKYALVFSYVGYKKKEVQLTITKDLSLNILLVPDEIGIGEVKVVAQRKFFGNMDYGRDIPSIEAEVIGKQTINNASDILHARVAGVWATKTSGAPGDHQKIRIRGQSSFFSSAEPLYVVDGVPVPIVNMSSLGIADLNIHDIENVTVLRDASSSSLYGFQGGNGVVLIDTKKGGGQVKFNFLTRQGYHWQSEFYDLMNTPDFLTSLDSARSIIKSQVRPIYPPASDTLCSHNRQEEFFSPGNSQEYQFSASGSKKSVNYYFSGNYLDHKGTLPNTRYTRYTLSTRLSRVFWKKLAIDLGYRGSWQNNENNQNEYKGNRLLFDGISKAPCLECTPDSLFYNERDALLYRTHYYGYYSLSNPELPGSIIEDNTHTLQINNHVLSAAVRFQINDQFHMDVMESFMSRPSLYESHFVYDKYFENRVHATRYEVALESHENVLLFNHQINLSYNNIFGKHTFGALLAHRFYKDNLWWELDSLEGSIPGHYILKNSMSAYGPEGSVVRTISSYITHLSYNFHEKYFFSATANLSHIKEELYTNYYSLFPSIALSWDLAREFNLHQNSKIKMFKLYVNWGQSGNYPLNGLGNELYRDVPYTLSDKTDYAPAVEQLANHNLRHENTRETDFGMQSIFFNGRVAFSAVYYTKTLSDMIILRDIPLYYGGGKQYLNVGAMSITGYEFVLELIPIQKANWYWSLMMNYSSSKQHVKQLTEEGSLIFNDPDILFPDFNIKEGDALGNIYGYKYLGKMTEQDWQSNSNSIVRYQKEKFLNADSTDSELTVKDKIILGNAIPDFMVNMTNTIQYKNLSVDFVWYAVKGVSKYNATRAATVLKGVNREANDFIADSVMIMKSSYFYETDIFVEDASFIRLKSVTFNYSPYKKIFDKVKMELSLSFLNPVTFTRYSGFDPEATIFTDNNFSDNAVDRGAYPSPKSFYATINLSF